MTDLNSSTKNLIKELKEIAKTHDVSFTFLCSRLSVIKEHDDLEKFSLIHPCDSELITVYKQYLDWIKGSPLFRPHQKAQIWDVLFQGVLLAEEEETK